MLKRNCLCLALAFLVWGNISAQAANEPEPISPAIENSVAEPYKAIPLTMAFHDIGWNTLRFITYNYGLNLIGAGLGTWAFIETGLDWKWNRLAYDNDGLAKAGLPTLYIGYAVPAAAPIALYITGRFIKDKKMQIAGLALTQTAMLSCATFAILKMATGRALPGIVTELDHTRSPRTDDFSREFSGFNWNFHGGWPAGHVMNALAAAAAVTEIYKDSIPLKIAVYSYAALIGLGTSVNVHWASDIWAGALIGYAIGKAVGRSFSQLLRNEEKDTVSLYVTQNAVGVILHL
jgi:membrane-associated phospholipid phosphatase